MADLPIDWTLDADVETVRRRLVRQTDTSRYAGTTTPLPSRGYRGQIGADRFEVSLATGSLLPTHQPVAVCTLTPTDDGRTRVTGVVRRGRSITWVGPFLSVFCALGLSVNLSRHALGDEEQVLTSMVLQGLLCCIPTGLALVYGRRAGQETKLADELSATLRDHRDINEVMESLELRASDRRRRVARIGMLAIVPGLLAMLQQLGNPHRRLVRMDTVHTLGDFDLGHPPVEDSVLQVAFDRAAVELPALQPDAPAHGPERALRMAWLRVIAEKERQERALREEEWLEDRVIRSRAHRREWRRLHAMWRAEGTRILVLMWTTRIFGTLFVLSVVLYRRSSPVHLVVTPHVVRFQGRTLPLHDLESWDDRELRFTDGTVVSLRWLDLSPYRLALLRDAARHGAKTARQDRPQDQQRLHALLEGP